MFLVTFGLLSPLIVTYGLGDAGETSTEGFYSINVGIKSNIVPTSRSLPVLDYFQTEKGFRFDRTKLPSENGRKEHQTYLGATTYGLLDGTESADWVSGVIQGCSLLYESTSKLITSSSVTPVYQTGVFTIFDSVRSLYSDFSVSQRLENTTMGDVTAEELSSNVVLGSISVCLYQRLNSFLMVPYKKYEWVDSFTPKLTDSGRAVLGHSLDFDNVSKRVNEFVIDEGSIFLNKNAQMVVGEPGTEDIFGSLWESKGECIPGHSYYTNFFPLKSGTVRLVSGVLTGVHTEWTEVDDFSETTESDYHYTVNHDLGIITVGGQQRGNLVLMSDISDSDTEISVYPDNEFYAYPEVGYFLIDDEPIYYSEKGNFSFLGCLRAWGSGSAASHTSGSVISEPLKGVRTNEQLYISYIAVPRMEYEVSSHEERTALELNLSNDATINNSGIIQLTSSLQSLSSLRLSASLKEIATNYYSELFFGTGACRLKVEALSSLGSPISELPVTIEVLDRYSKLNMYQDTIVRNTSVQGECFVQLNAANDVGYKYVIPEYGDGVSYLTIADLSTFARPRDIHLFQILKHDGFYGTAGTLFEVIDATTPTAGEPQQVTLSGLITEDYVGGKALILGLDGTSYVRAIVNTASDKVYFDSIVPVANFPNNLYLLKNGEVEWDSETLNGVKVILYRWYEDVENPITGDDGAYAPLRPTGVYGRIVEYGGDYLPIANPEDPDSNLGGYYVTYPVETSIRATAVDPVTGNSVVSNIIKIKINYSSVWGGVDYSGTLPVPYGWKFPTDENNVGAALANSNFITINPEASVVESFSLRLEVP